MNFSKFFIDRPIFAGVLSAVIFLAGLLSLPVLPISEYPEVAPPTIVVTVGPPVQMQYDDLDADTKRMMEAISALLPPEGRETREPSEDELRRTFPSNYKGNPDAEDDRRPGFDS